MRPITLGIGLVIAAVAGGSMILSGGSSGSEDGVGDDRAGRVMSSRGQRRPQGLESAGRRSMFRSVETWGGRERTQFAAEAPSRLEPEERDRYRARAQAQRETTRQTTGLNDRVGASNRRPVDETSRDRLREARRVETESRAQQRELDAQQRRLSLQRERMQRLEEARLRQTRGLAGSSGAVSAQTIRAAAAAREAGISNPSGESGDGDGAPRDPNAPPSMEEIMDLFDAFGIDPNSGTTGSGTRSGSSSGGSGSSGGTRSGSGSGSGSTTSPTGSGVGGGPVTTVTGNGTSGLEASVSTLWLPVNQSACTIETQGLRTNDLYIRIEVTSSIGAPIPESIRVVTLNFPGLEITGGVYNNPDDSLVVPNPELFNLVPCAEFDTFLSFGESGGSLFPGPDFEDPLESVIDAALLNLDGVPATKNRSILNDDAFYMRIARISAPTTITDLEGTVDIGLLLGSGFGAFANADDVPITFETSIWRSLEGLQAVWVPVEIGDTSDCDPGMAAKLNGVDSFDLVLRRDDPFDLVFVTAVNGANTQPLELTGGIYFFHNQHDANDQEPTNDDILMHPCLEYDSFLTIDTSATPESPPSTIVTSDWTSTTLSAIWGVANLDSVDTAVPEPALQDQATFGDDGYYIRVARISVEKGSQISGAMLVSWVAVLPGDNRLPIVTLTPVCDFADVTCPAP